MGSVIILIRTGADSARDNDQKIDVQNYARKVQTHRRVAIRHACWRRVGYLGGSGVAPNSITCCNEDGKGSNYFVGVKHAGSRDARKIRTIIVCLAGVVTFERCWKVGIKS